MKRSQFSGLLFCVAFVCFLTSCNNDSKEEKSTTDSSGTTVNPTPVAPEVVNTIITSPQSMMIVTHKVSDFDKWMASFEEHDSMRLAFGIHKYIVGRSTQDPNTVLVVVKVDDMAKAKAFAKDPSLKMAMQKSGVVGAPTITFGTTTWQDTVQIATDLRSRTSFAVKDWANWEKNFAEGKQERLDNGITDRAYGHDADDNKKVSLVTAITDTAKAFAYYKSDALKKRREAGGVIGEPKRFLYRVVKKY